MTRDEVLAVLQEKAALHVDAPLVLAEPFPGDSLAVIEWVMDLEDALGIELSEERVSRTETVEDVLQLCLDTS